MGIPCNAEGREHKSWVECPEGSGETARKTVICNADELAQAIADAIGTVGGGGNGTMTCDYKVVNIVGGIPLTVSTTEIDNICDFEFLDDQNNKIELGAKKTGPTTIEICSNVSLNNVQVYLTGDQ